MFRIQRFLRVAALSLLVAGCEAERATQPPAPVVPPSSAADLVRQFEQAYRARDYNAFASILSGEAGAEYLFIHEPSSPGDHQWGRAEELRIHQRMFRPQDIPRGERPLNPDLWLVSIDISLAPQGAFTEAPGFYRSDANPDGLDPAVWRASEAVYNTDVLFDTQGERDYQVTGRESFVVIENLAKNIGDAGKFLMYRWEDLGTRRSLLAVQGSSWGAVKILYK